MYAKQLLCYESRSQRVGAAIDLTNWQRKSMVCERRRISWKQQQLRIELGLYSDQQHEHIELMNAKAWNFSRLFCSISLVTHHKTYIAHVIRVVTRCISESITISRSLLNQAREIIARSLQSQTDHVYPYSLSIHIGCYSNQSADLSIGEGNHESIKSEEESDLLVQESAESC